MFAETTSKELCCFTSARPFRQTSHAVYLKTPDEWKEVLYTAISMIYKAEVTLHAVRNQRTWQTNWCRLRRANKKAETRVKVRYLGVLTTTLPWHVHLLRYHVLVRGNMMFVDRTPLAPLLAIKRKAHKKLSYRWQTVRCWFVKLLRWHDFLSEYVDKKFTYIILQTV